MSWRLIALTLLLMTSTVDAQQPVTEARTPAPTEPVFVPGEVWNSPPVVPAGEGEPGSGFLTGNHNFPNFINFISNPLMAIDPRAVTAVYPIFGSVWVSNASPIPDGDGQVYGPAITIALSDRFAVGVNQGGLADFHFGSNPVERLGILRDEIREGLASSKVASRVDTHDFSGDRFGFLNLGGFFQYTLIEDVPDQFLLTVGMRWEAPAGSTEVFQGHGPLHLAPYFTAGKEYGEYHVLLTGGYEFPAGPGNDNTKLFYGALHLDRRCFGWLYPLVEFNGDYLERAFDYGLSTRRGFIDFGNFQAQGNVLTLAAGANAVVVPQHVEFGAVYTTTIATERDFNSNGVIVKMTFRY
jgi:hypothetical protein